jgi:hypothetical protein
MGWDIRAIQAGEVSRRETAVYLEFAARLKTLFTEQEISFQLHWS